MNKQNLRNVWKRVGRLSGFLLLPAFALLFAACDEDKAKPERPNEGDLLQEIVPVLTPPSSDFNGVDHYGVFLYLFNELSSECFKYQEADSFDAIHSMTVERAAYSLTALLVDPTTSNLSFATSLDAVKNQTITVVDMNREIPDIVIGTVEVSQEVKTPVEITELQRLVGSLNIRLTDVPDDVTAIEVTVNGLYDQVSFGGEYGFSTGSAATKKIELTKSGTTFAKQVTLFPSDASLESVKMNFRLYRGTEYHDYLVRLTGQIVANQVTQLSGKADDILQSLDLSYGFIYLPWSERETINDDLTITDDLTKVWSSENLPISGAQVAYGAHDNFWASSSFVDWDGSVKKDEFLYDGVKDLEHKDDYWGSDAAGEQERGTIPSWFVDLGSQREGVTVKYWNKFGGKGGAKIKTITLYGSNKATDYTDGHGGPDPEWVEVGSFTSTKTASSVDAGAEVDSGRIEFNQGKSSYRYLKCAITACVNADGNDIDNSDANVAEVEITVWSCK